MKKEQLTFKDGDMVLEIRNLSKQHTVKHSWMSKESFITAKGTPMLQNVEFVALEDGIVVMADQLTAYSEPIHRLSIKQERLVEIMGELIKTIQQDKYKDRSKWFGL